MFFINRYEISEIITDRQTGNNTYQYNREL